MRITCRFQEDNVVVKWAKLSLFAIGALIAIPMMFVSVVLCVTEVLAHRFITWLQRVTDTDINF